MHKVVVTGPESSGKTSLAEALAQHYRVPWVPEMARPYLDVLDAPYREEDLAAIGRAQLRAEDLTARSCGSAGLLVCDTDLITIRIWGEEKYGRSDPWVVRCTEERPYALWLLCAPDIPWEYDPQRENPHDRDRLFAVYERTLIALGKPYTVVQGDRAERLAQAVAAVERLD